MYFCPNCNNVFNITKGDSSAGKKYVGGDNEENQEMKAELGLHLEGGADLYDRVITKVMSGEELDKKDIDSISLDELMQSFAYKKLKLKQKQFIYNKIQELLPLDKKQIFNENETKQNTEKAYFICTNCGYKKPIKKNTLIFSKVASDVTQNYVSSDVIDMKYSDILPRTRKYLCPNKSCDSHEDFNKREAVFFRTNNTFKVKYICLACDAIF